MTIDKIFDRILLRSGQFILRKAKIEMDVDSFRLLVEDALSEYSGFVPHTKQYSLNMNSSRSFKFSDTYDPVLKRAPDWVSSATPIASFGAVSNVFHQDNNLGGEPSEPILAPWVYNKETKVLTVSRSAHYDVIAVYDHEVLEEIVDGKTVYSAPTISNKDQPFFSILRAMFLIGIGRSRRAFTLSDLPILMDADTLVSDGEALLEKAMEEILDDQKFFLAWE